MSKSDFEKLAYLKSEFFNYGLKIDSNPESVIETDKEVNITLFAPKNILLIAGLEYEAQDQSSDQEALKDFTLCQMSGNRYSIYADFPKSGKYILRTFAKNKNESGEYHEVLEYLINVSSNKKENISYPKTFSMFTESGAHLYSPMEGELKSGTPYGFSLRVPDASNVSVINGDKWSDLSRKGELFEGKLVCLKGKVEVCAKFPARNTYDGLLLYTAV